jgi:hypothetical protein
LVIVGHMERFHHVVHVWENRHESNWFANSNKRCKEMVSSWTDLEYALAKFSQVATISPIERIQKVYSS